MEKLRKLILRLLDRTRRGLIDWRPTASDDSFQTSLSDTTLRIIQSSPNYILAILDSDGHLIESASDIDLDRDIVPIHYPPMKELFDLARRKALKIDEVLDYLLNELGGS